MSMPFDTLKPARRLESAGFPHQQAANMSDAIAEAAANIVIVTGMPIATKYFG